MCGQIAGGKGASDTEIGLERWAEARTCRTCLAVHRNKCHKADWNREDPKGDESERWWGKEGQIIKGLLC